MRAFALAFVLLLIPLLLVLGISFMAFSGCDYGFSGRAAGRVRAFYLADSGARYAYYERARLRIPPPPGQTNTPTHLTLSTGDVWVTVDNLHDGTTRIMSYARSGSATAQVIALVDYYGRIRAWQELGSGIPAGFLPPPAP